MIIVTHRLQWATVLFCFLLLYTEFTFAQEKSSLSISEIHTLIERHINYSRDSSMTLLNLAKEKIQKLDDEDMVEQNMAENNLRRADYWTYYNIDSSKFYLDKAYAYYQSNINHKKLADIFVLKAQLIRIEARIDKDIMDRGLACFDSAFMHAERLVDPAFLSFIYYEKSISLQFTERWEESFENALLAMKYAETANDSLSMATAYFLMGRTYHHFGLFNSAEKNIAKAVEYGKGMDQWYTIIHIYADVLLQNQKTDLAFNNYKKALKISLDKDDTQKATTLYTHLGRIELDRGNYSFAENYFLQLSSILRSKDEAGYKTLLFMAQMYYYLGDEAQARKDLNLFGEKYGNGKIIPRTIDVFKEAADLHSALGEPEQATLYYKKWGFLKDSLYSHTSKQQLSALEEMYLNEKNKNEIIIHKNEELNKSRRQQATMGGLLIVVVLLGSGLVYFIRMKGLKENQSLKFALKEKQMEQMIDAQETERQRLARELHDGIGQSLAALKMKLQFDKTPQASDTTVQRLDSICNEVRSLSHQMMPILLKENGLESAIKQLIDQNFSGSSIDVEFVSSGLYNRLPDNIEVNVYRITQELISNIIKHSNASKVGIQLLKRGKKLVLIVEDDGEGFKITDKTNGIGLNNVHVRLEALGGTVQIQAVKGEGAYVHITVPTSSEVTKQIA